MLKPNVKFTLTEETTTLGILSGVVCADGSETGRFSAAGTGDETEGFSGDGDGEDAPKSSPN